MDSDPDETDRNGTSTVPVGSIPVPVVGYDATGEEPVITETNEPLESTFEGISVGTAVSRWLHREVGVDESRVEEVCASLATGNGVDVELEAEPATGSEPLYYRFRTFGEPADAAGADGYVLLAECGAEHDDDAEIDRIASVISHDLRNPLDVANAHLRAARETGDEEHFDQVRRSHDRMEQIIQDVLTLARGKNALSIAGDVDIGTVATDAWATVDTEDASLTVEDDLPTAAADPDRLQRLFENLFRNSIEHAHPTARGRATDGDRPNGTDHPLRVLVGRTDGGFFVADNGTGIPEEDRTRVFDPGYSSNETGGGTGLGLTIVEEIAEAHDWTVTLTTGQRGGARFEFRPLSGTSRS